MITIEIRDVPLNAPEIYLEPDGRLLLDLGENFGFSLTKAPSEGNELNEIKREGTESFQVPLTPKNRWIFRRWLFPNADTRDFSRLRVYAMDGVHLLPEDRMGVLRVSLPEGVIEVGLFESGELGLVDGAKNLYLNTVDFGTFTLTAANLETNWANAVYEDAGDPFYWGLVHYGNFIVDTSEVSPEDFRPLLSILGTLQRGFQALGWVFKSPLEECDWFKRLWWYGLGKEYYKHSDWGRLIRIDVQTSADLVVVPDPVNELPENIIFDVETEDFGDNHDDILPTRFTQTQDLAGVVSYRLTGQIENNDLINAQTVPIDVMKPNAGTYVSFNVFLAPGETQDVDLQWEFEFVPGSIFVVAVRTGALDGNVTVKSGFRLQASPTEKYYHRGDIIDIRESIDPNYSFLEFLQGLAHMGFRFESDRGTMTVRMYPPEDVDIFGEGTFQGYYRPAYDAEDVTLDTVADSAVFQFPQEDIPEFLVIGFKQSTDKYIEGLEIPEDSPLYSKRVQFRQGVRGQVDYSENPFFEPTSNYRWFGGAQPQISSPAMWDNSDGQRSFEIAPRILYAAGLVEQTAQTGDGVAARQWSFNGAIRTTLPYVFQVPEAPIGNPPALPSGYVVYDDPALSTYSIWRMFLRFDNRFARDLPKMEILLWLNSTDYHKFSFRNRIRFDLLGRPTVVKVLAIRDFQSGEDIPTPVEVQIDPTYED